MEYTPTDFKEKTETLFQKVTIFNTEQFRIKK